MRIENQGPGPSKDSVLQIEQGGTSATNNSEALFNLGVVGISEINQPGGVAGYEQGTKKLNPDVIPSITGGLNTVTIEGQNSIVYGESAVLKITNFDSFTDYVLSYNKFEGEIEGDTILVTAIGVGNGHVKVNGSIFPINITIANPPLAGDVVFRSQGDGHGTSILTNSNASYVLVARSKKDYMGSIAAGEVELYRRDGEVGLTSLHRLSPEILDTVISYGGVGTKKFTANNVVTERTGTGSITLSGAGNILIEGQGGLVTIPGASQQGLPEYPNGLPPYAAPTAAQGNPSYPGGLPPYSPAVYAAASHVIQNNFCSGTSADGVSWSWTFYNSGIDYQSVTVLTAMPSVNHSLVRVVGGSVLDGTYVVRTIGEFVGTYSVTGGGLVQSGQGNPSYPSGLPPYNPGNPAQGNASYPSGLPVYRPASPQQGLPEYPNGLLPYVAPSSPQGHPSYPSGLPPYIPASAAQGNPSYPSGLPPYVAASPGQPYIAPTAAGWQSGPIFYNFNDGNPYGWPSSIYFAVNPDGSGHPYAPSSISAPGHSATLQSSSLHSSGFGDASYSSSEGWYISYAGNIASNNGSPGQQYVAPTAQQGNPSYPSGLPPYNPGGPGQGNASYPSGLPPYNPGNPEQGNPSYPSGLPSYAPAGQDSSYTDAVTFSSNRFEINGITVNHVVTPFGNNFLGQSIALAENGTYATGSTLEEVQRLTHGGEVIVIHHPGGTKQHLTIPYVNPHPRFGATVQLKADASHLLVGAPGSNTIYLYRNTSGSFNTPVTTTPAGLGATAKFGELIDSDNTFSRVYVCAPEQGAFGTVYAYTLTGNTLTLQETIVVPDLPTGTKIHNRMRCTNTPGLLYLNTHKVGTNTYNVVELKKIGVDWVLSNTFSSPSPETPDFFGSHFDISKDGVVLTASAPGSTSMKGTLNIWVLHEGEWIFYDSVIDDEADFGDRFGDLIALAHNGKSAFTIHRTDNKDDILYLK